MDEATLFKFSKWIEYGKFHHRGKGQGLGHVTFNIFGMDEATLLSFSKCINYGKTHTSGKIPPKRMWSGSRDRFLNFKLP